MKGSVPEYFVDVAPCALNELQSLTALRRLASYATLRLCCVGRHGETLDAESEAADSILLTVNAGELRV
jgi:hypothetical protein